MPGLVLAGSGSNLPLVRALADLYAENHDVTMHVRESIGPSGAVNAVLDRAVDVGLASRPLTSAEEARGLVATPLAISVVVFGAAEHQGASLSRAELAAVYHGERRVWPDGHPIVPLLREPGDSSIKAAAEAWPEVAEAMECARRTPGALVFHTDQEMADALSSIAGAVGVIDLGIMRLDAPRLTPVAVDGALPDLGDGDGVSWRARKPLYFLTFGPPTGEVARFVAWTNTPPARRFIQSSGYVLTGGGRDE